MSLKRQCSLRPLYIIYFLPLWTHTGHHRNPEPAAKECCKSPNLLFLMIGYYKDFLFSRLIWVFSEVNKRARETILKGLRSALGGTVLRYCRRCPGLSCLKLRKNNTLRLPQLHFISYLKLSVWSLDKASAQIETGTLACQGDPTEYISRTQLWDFLYD